MSKQYSIKKYFKTLFIIASVSGLTSCSSIINNTILEPTVNNLQQQTDVDLVCEGAPTFLLLLDSMVVSDPGNKDMLIMASQSYTGYISAMISCDPDSPRLEPIADKAEHYGKSLLTTLIPLDAKSGNLDETLAKMKKKNVPTLFWGSVSWLGWIQLQNGSPDSIAAINIIKKVMERIIELDPTYQGAAAHLFMGTYLSSIPAMLGGDPEKAKDHFEFALRATDRKSLMVQVAYAEKYCRATMNQQLHDSLLQEVIDFDILSAPEYTLTNQIAKRQAKQLLEDNFF